MISLEDWALIRHLHRGEKLSQRAIAKRLGVARGTVSAALSSDGRRSMSGRRWSRHAANLFFQLVSSRYEHASLILTSNLPFARWGDSFGDQVVAAAMIDRIVHHAEVLTLKGSSYRVKDTGIDTLSSARADNTAQQPNNRGLHFNPSPLA